MGSEKLNILAKSNSTVHIPTCIKSKHSKRLYACFDTNTSIKMFGYRVNFAVDAMKEGIPDPKNDQDFKPIKTFAADIVSELNKGYE